MPSRLAEHFLADKQRCGIYRTAPQWQADTQAPGLCWKTLAPLPAINRESLLVALGETLAFPDYYGQNWDAAWDCLTELSWPADQLLMLHLPIPADRAVVEADLEVFLELMADACQHWAERGRALCLLVESTQPGLSCLEDMARLEDLA